MTEWIINCSEDELDRALADGVVRHSDALAISPNDTIYLHVPTDASLVGPLTAIGRKQAVDEDTDETLFEIANEGPRKITTDELPRDVSEGEISTRGRQMIETEFEYESKSVSLADSPEATSQEQDDETPPDDATLATVLTEEYDARGRDFSGQSAPPNQFVGDVVLRDCDFSGADLEGVTFRGTDLRDSDFRGANLEGVVFDHGVKIQGADFTKARMNGATLATDVTASIFRLTVLTDGDLTRAALDGADFSESYLRRADFSETNPKRIDFRGATLRGMRTSGSTFEYNSFVDADLRNVNFGGAEINDCDFTDARLDGGDFSDATLHENDFTDAHLNRADFSGVDVRGHDFEGADLEEATFSAAIAGGVSFQDARLTSVDFTEATLDGTRFVGAQADDTEFDHANLTGATFAQADLFDSSFENARLYGCHLASARVDSAEPFKEVYTYERDDSDPDARGLTLDRETDPVPSEMKAASVYRTLEAVMENNSHTSTALCYFFRRKEALRKLNKRNGTWTQRTVDAFSRLVVSHGIRYRLLFTWTFLVLVGSACLYFGNDWLLYRGADLSFGSSTYTSLEGFGLTLLFSVYSFTGLGFGEFSPIGAGRVLSVGETAVGILFFALFIYVFTTRASR